MTRRHPHAHQPNPPPDAGSPRAGDQPTAGGLAAVPLTYLDPVESKSPSSGLLLPNVPYRAIEHSTLEPITLTEATFRHSSWAARRARIWAAMQRLHVGTSAQEAFASCGSALYAYQREEDGTWSLRSNKCRSKHCVPCGRDRANTIRSNLLQHTDHCKVRFITLTLRHNKTKLADQIARLYNSFRTLRRRSFWKCCVTGGAAFLEVKVSDKDGLWHPHLHLIVSGEYIPQKDLSTEWLAVTGDSSIVDVRAVKDEDSVTGYVLKYVTKGCSDSILADEELLDEYVTAVKGVHQCMTWGTWRGWRLLDTETPIGNWICRGRVETIFAAANAGDRESQFTATLLTAAYPALEILLDSS